MVQLSDFQQTFSKKGLLEGTMRKFHDFSGKEAFGWYK